MISEFTGIPPTVNSSECQVNVALLDWTQVDQNTIQLFKPDVIIAADVVCLSTSHLCSLTFSLRPS